MVCKNAIRAKLLKMSGNSERMISPSGGNPVTRQLVPIYMDKLCELETGYSLFIIHWLECRFFSRLKNTVIAACRSQAAFQFSPLLSRDLLECAHGTFNGGELNFHNTHLRLTKLMLLN